MKHKWIILVCIMALVLGGIGSSTLRKKNALIGGGAGDPTGSVTVGATGGTSILDGNTVSIITDGAVAVNNAAGITSDEATVALFDTADTTKVDFAGNAAVDVGKSGLATTVKGALNVDEAATFDNDLTVDATALFVDTSNDWVGLGLIPLDRRAKVQIRGYDNDTSDVSLSISSGASAVSALIHISDGVNHNWTFGTFGDTTGDFVWNSGGWSGSIGTERVRFEQSGNVGIGTANPGAKLEVAGDFTAGDGTNELLVATDGFTTLAGTARAVMEMKHNALDLLGPGPGNPPAGPNLTGHTFTLDFEAANDEEVFITMEMPHNWDVGTDVKVNFHWAPIDNGGGTVTWGVETKIITPESGLLTEASIATQIVVDNTQTTEDKFLVSDMITIDTSGASIGDFLALRIFRDANASEGGASDSYTSDAQLVAFHMEYIVNSFGSDEAW